MNAVAQQIRPSTTTRRWSRGLGYAGLVPFATALTLPWLDDPVLAVTVQHTVIAYGAVILSFVGALHWHAGLLSCSPQESVRRLGFSVLPALLGWAALLLAPALACALLIAGFVLVYGFDRHWQIGDNWFLQLRRHLTVGASVCLAVTLVAVLFVN